MERRRSFDFAQDKPRPSISFPPDEEVRGYVIIDSADWVRFDGLDPFPRCPAVACAPGAQDF